MFRCWTRASDQYKDVGCAAVWQPTSHKTWTFPKSLRKMQTKQRIFFYSPLWNQKKNWEAFFRYLWPFNLSIKRSEALLLLVGGVTHRLIVFCWILRVVYPDLYQTFEIPLSLSLAFTVEAGLRPFPSPYSDLEFSPLPFAVQFLAPSPHSYAVLGLIPGQGCSVWSLHALAFPLGTPASSHGLKTCLSS